MTQLLEVRNLSAGYGGRPVVQGISFILERGVVVLAGPNGAGKSTVLRVLATLHPFEGEASLAGCDLSTAPGRRQARRLLVFLPQEADFPRDFTIAEALTYAAWLQRVPAGRRPHAVEAALSAVDLRLVRVGGAAGSLLGLAPRPGLQAGQVALYLTVGIWSVLEAGHMRRALRADRAPTLVTGALAAVLGAGLFFNQGDDFARRRVALRCTGAPPVCLAPGYDRDPEAVHRALAPYLEGLEAVGIPPPTRFVQDVRDREELVGRISHEFALGDATEARYAVVSAYYKSDCEIARSEGVYRAWIGVIDWLDTLGGNPISPDDPTVPEVLESGSAEEQAAWIRDALGRLRNCA